MKYRQSVSSAVSSSGARRVRPPGSGWGAAASCPAQYLSLIHIYGGGIGITLISHLEHAEQLAGNRQIDDPAMVHGMAAFLFHAGQLDIIGIHQPAEMCIRDSSYPTIDQL